MYTNVYILSILGKWELAVVDVSHALYTYS